jgi:hypothetical protein
MKDDFIRSADLVAFVLAFLVFFGAFAQARPCTIAVVSGRATPDGRPLIWKNRDSGVQNNKVLCVSEGKYAFLGLVNAGDNSGQSVWAGANSAGLVIMNSAAPDLFETPTSGEENGTFMSRALAECATVRDFEGLLFWTNGRRNTAANFGVMDAEGKACLFETGRATFVKFDAADLRVAPQGYILRTNFTLTAAQKTGGGYNRYDRAVRLFQTARAENRLTCRFLLQEAARDLVNDKIASYPLDGPVRGTLTDPLYVRANDTLNQSITSFAVVFQGVGRKDKAYLTTMWVALGQPVTSVALPVWPAAPAVPLVLTGEATAPLDDIAQAIRRYLYPDQRPNMDQYLNVTRLRTYRGVGIPVLTKKIEDELLSRVAVEEAKWDKRKPSLREMIALEGELAAWAYEEFRSAFAGFLSAASERE